jgi:hypothetical protein
VLGDRREEVLVAGLGHHEPDVRVRGVAQEVLFPAGVVQADDRRARQRRPTEREEVVGRVVEQEPDVERPVLGGSVEEQVGPAAGFRDVLLVRPDAVAELHRRPVADRGIGGVAAQQRGGVRRRHGRQTGRRRGATHRSCP